MVNVDQVIIVLLLLPLAMAVASDASTLRIPNRIPLAICALYPAHLVAAWPDVDPIGGLLCGAATLVVGYVAFARNLIGGGDAKLLASLALWAGPVLIVDLIVVTGLAGGVMALGMVTWTLMRRRLAVWRDGAAAEGPVLWRLMPYGIAIAAGGIHVVIRLLTGGIPHA